MNMAYSVVYASSKYLPDALNELREIVGKKQEKAMSFWAAHLLPAATRGFMSCRRL